MIQKITPFLWFDGKAEEAARFYVAIFPNSSIEGDAEYGDEGPGEAGSVMTVSFTLEGQRFVALNGGPLYEFTPAISFQIGCETQAEVDHYWERLSDGGEEVQCGWLRDRFGISWQVVPNVLPELLGDPDDEKSGRVMKAMLGMVKLDIAALRAAHDGP